VGGAVAVLSAQVDDLDRALTIAQQTAATSAQTLTDLTKRAEDMSRRLELQMASLHDIPAAPVATSPTPPPPAREAVHASTPMFARRAAATGDST
jgi:hypothetical protein